MQLTVREIAAVIDYTGAGYERMNAYLRGGQAADAELEQSITALNSAVAKATTTTGLTVYRGYPKSLGDYLRTTNIRVGSILSDAAFLSTSRSDEVAKQFADWPEGLMVRIFIPAGSKALDVAPYSMHPHEEEILLPRGTRLRIVGYDGAKVLDAEVI